MYYISNCVLLPRIRYFKEIIKDFNNWVKKAKINIFEVLSYNNKNTRIKSIKSY